MTGLGPGNSAIFSDSSQPQVVEGSQGLAMGKENSPGQAVLLGC